MAIAACWGGSRVCSRTAQSLLGQARPGQQIHLRYCSLAEATAAYRAQQGQIRELTRRVRTVFTRLGIRVSDK
jgi:allophanate hydrolase subunit 2